MKQLNEFLNWVNSVEEVKFLAEGKGHMDHPEDMVILGGMPSFMPLSQALATIDRAAADPKKITIKFDGYPAIIFGSGPDGKFSIMDKHMFNRGADRPKIYSPKQFAEYEASRGDKARTGLVDTVTKIWPSLQRSYSGNGWYMGDLMFDEPLTDDNGVYQFRPNPNGILYKVNVDSELGRYLTGKQAGVAVHRWLDPNALSTEDNVTWLSNLGNLNPQGSVALLPVSMPVTPKITLNKNLKAQAEGAKSTEKQIYDFISNAPQTASAFANIFTVYLNDRIVTGNMKNLYTNFYPWVKQRLDNQLAGKKISPKMHAALTDYLNQNKATVKQLFKNWIDVYNYKMDIVKQINAAAQESPIKGYLQTGQESQEGFVYGGLKFVDRQGFSAQNLAARQKVTEAKDIRKVLVIYPGGFHPFHRGHAAVYHNLKKNFPSAEVYVAATDSTTERPFQFDDKKKLARLAGVPKDRFIKVKSPYRAEEITSAYNPKNTILIFALSEKDKDRMSFAPKKNGQPSYFQPYRINNLDSFDKHAYVYVTPKVNFDILGKQVDSASTIRKMYAGANDDERKQIAAQLYPDTPNTNLAKQVLDKYLAPEITEADNPDYFGGSSQSAIPGTPQDLMPGPDEEEIRQYKKEMASLKRFMGH